MLKPARIRLLVGLAVAAVSLGASLGIAAAANAATSQTSRQVVTETEWSPASYLELVPTGCQTAEGPLVLVDFQYNILADERIDLLTIDGQPVGDDVETYVAAGTHTFVYEVTNQEQFTADSGKSVERSGEFTVETCAPTVTPSPTPTPTSSAPATSISGWLSSATVAPDGSVVANGAGFAAGEQVQIWLHSTPAQLATVTANAAGGLSQSVVIPASTTLGAHQIELRGADSGSVLLDLTVEKRLAATGADTHLAAPLTALAMLAIGGLLLVIQLRARRRLVRR